MIGVKLSLVTRPSIFAGESSVTMIDHEDLTMRKRSLLLLSLLVPAFLGLGGYAVVQGQQKGSPVGGVKRWPDAATWPD